MAETRLRYPLGSEISTNWICIRPIEGLISACVIFCREPTGDEVITLDEFELRAGPDDYELGAYKLYGRASHRLAPGVYRPVAARVRVLEHPRDVFVDLGRYSEEFAIVLFDDSFLATTSF
jgi:hypothetical protein